VGRCRHGNGVSVPRLSPHEGDGPYWRRCLDCKELLPLGPANDKPWQILQEMELAKWLASYEDHLADDVIDAFLDGDAAETERQKRQQEQQELLRSRVLSPIELAVDRACGVSAVLDEGDL